MFNLFDAYVASILNYGFEAWGFTRAENIERILQIQMHCISKWEETQCIYVVICVLLSTF